MKWLNKVPGSRREPPGFEWKLFRKLPLIALAGTLLPLACAALMHAFAPAGEPLEVAKWLQRADFIAMGAVFVHWNLCLALAVGCVVVMVMKGPMYTADSYEVPDRNRPL